MHKHTHTHHTQGDHDETLCPEPQIADDGITKLSCNQFGAQMLFHSVRACMYVCVCVFKCIPSYPATNSAFLSVRVYVYMWIVCICG